MSLKFFDVDRIRMEIEVLERNRVHSCIDINSFTAYEDDGAVAIMKPPFENTPFEHKQGDLWGGVDNYVWLTTKLTVPKEWVGKEVMLDYNIGRTGQGHNTGFESMLFINGEMWQGADMNHHESFVDLEKFGTQLEIWFRMWSGRLDELHLFEYAKIGLYDKHTDDAYYLMSALADTADFLPDSNENRHIATRILLGASKLLCLAKPGDAEFYRSTKAASEYINSELEKEKKNTDINVWCAGSTHIDVAWLWRYKHTREKAARSFKTAIKYMKRYPEYIFMMPQAQIYEFVKNDYPELYEEIKAAVKNGQWEPSGGMWVESDCNIPSGESLTRQFLYATRFFEQEFDFKSKFLWLPDVFGYSWAMPQILKECEIDTFMTTKISWNATNRIPADTFMWRGVDGTDMLTHFITTPDDDAAEWCDNGFITVYGGKIFPYTVRGIWDMYQNKDLTKDLMLSYGLGDGGGGPTRDMIEYRRRLDKIPGLPNVKTKQVTQYFKELHKTVEENPNNARIQIYDSELYFECSRGTYTSQARHKRLNRKTEYALRNKEFLCAFAGVDGKDTTNYPTDTFVKCWKVLLKNQFHDVLPGTSVNSVYEMDVWSDFEQISKDLAPIGQITDGAPGVFTVFNTLPWKRTSQVTIAGADGFDPAEYTYYQNGEKLAWQPSEQGITLKVLDVPAMGYVQIDCEKAKPEQTKGTITVNGNTAETKFYSIEWNNHGQIVKLYDKTAGRPAISGVSNLLQAFEDSGDAWEVIKSFENKIYTITQLLECKVKTQSAISTVINFKWQYNETIISQDMVLYEDDPRIDFVTEVDMKQKNTMIKAGFNVDIQNTFATYDIQYGNLTRPITNNNTWEDEQFEVCGHKWADLSETGYGVAVLNDCKYGYDIKNGLFRITLLRSTTFPDHSGDIAQHKFTYSFLPHTGTWQQAQIEKSAADLNVELFALPGKMSTANSQLLELVGDGVQIDSVKVAEDGGRIIVRMHEYNGGRASVSLKSPYKVEKWCGCNMLERQDGQMQTGKIELELRPYQVKTIKIWFDGCK